MRAILSQRTQQRLSTAQQMRAQVGLDGEGWETRVVAGLLGHADDALLEAARTRLTKGTVRFHAIEIALLRRLGVDPSVAMMLATLVEVVEILDRDDGDTAKYRALVADGMSMVVAEPGRLSWSTREQTLVTGPLPASVMASALMDDARGTALADIVSIPGVDGLDLSVQRIRARDDGANLELVRTPLLSAGSLVKALEPIFPRSSSTLRTSGETP